MKVRLRVVGELARGIGTSSLTLELSDDSTVGDLLSLLGSSFPSVAPGLGNTIAFVEGRHVGPTQRLSADQEVALLRPIAGGR